MACDLKPSIERMMSKLFEIEDLCVDACFDAAKTDKLGTKYMTLSKAIGKIAVLVRDTMTVREYWYAKFVEEGVLVQPEEKKCDWDSNRCGSGCLVYDDNVKMSKTIVTLKSEIEALKNGDNTEMR